MEPHVGYLGTALLLLAGAIAWWRSKQVFKRTNQFGIEQFPTLAAKARARLSDGVAMVAAFLFGMSGVLLLAWEFQDSWGWIVLLPFLVWILFALIGA